MNDMMDIFCTSATRNVLTERQYSPDDIAYYMEEDTAPFGCILVTDGRTAVYLLLASDFKPTSRLRVYDEDYTVIEHFENGIPEWLEPMPTLYYLCEWTGTTWTFTKVN